MENQEEADIIEDEEIITSNGDEIITDKNDPEKVTSIRPDPRCCTTSVGDKIIGSGGSIIKRKRQNQTENRSWFNFG